MLALGRFLQQQAQGDGDVQYDQAVEQLVQRVSEAVLVQDRREALQELRDLVAGSPRAQLAFGAVGFTTILHVVRDREDLEMVQAALECLAAAVSGDAGSQAVAINAQQLARAPDALPLLLSLLEQGPAGGPDFYARYHTLQVLKGLAAAAPRQLQEAILGAPLGVTRLMELLGEQEVLRNEALLLLTQLAGGSADLQKIAAFEGAFDRLFGIVREEGWLDGDIVVQDCLQLLAALLRGSPPNQLMFRETGFLAQLPPLLRLPEGATADGEGKAPELAPQQAANLAAALEVVLALLPPPAAAPGAPLCAEQAENRRALAQRGLLEGLAALALRGGGAPDDGVRAQALLCLAALISGSLLQQDQLAAATVQGGDGQPQPLLLAALRAALEGPTAAEQTAADRLLEAYCCGNAAGQAVLAGTLLHGGTPPPDSFGGLLLAGLGRQGGLGELAAGARAAAALAHLLGGNPGLRPHLLTLQVQLQGGPAAAASLMALSASRLGQLLTRHGRAPGSVRAAADTLRLLLPWLHACPPAVTAFLRAVAQSQPFLVDSIRGSNACSGCAASAHPLTRGMLALLLGLCAAHAEEGVGTPSGQQLLGAIHSQIGQQQFGAHLDAMLQHCSASAGAGGGGGGGSSSSAVFGDGPSVSPAFAEFLSGLAAEVRHHVTGVALPPAAAAAAAAAGHVGAAAPPPPAAATAVGTGSPRWAAPPARSATPSPLGMQQPPAYASFGAAPPASTPSAASPAPSLPSTSPRAGAAGSAAAPSAPPVGEAATGQLAQALAAAEALQRENRQLRAELAALQERLRLDGGAPNGTHAAAAAAAADDAALRQQLAAAQAEAAEARGEAERAARDAAAGRAAALKLESDLQDLSAAYSTLDAHAGGLQQQLEQARLDLAAAAQRQQGDGGEAEVRRRVEAAREEAAAEADEAMTDLLVCLGQEEAKVARLRGRLEGYGVDCDALLADIAAAGEAAAEEDMT